MAQYIGRNNEKRGFVASTRQLGCAPSPAETQMAALPGRLFQPTSQLGRFKIMTCFLQHVDRIPNQPFEVGDSLLPDRNRGV